jgi:hypothetical protein
MPELPDAEVSKQYFDSTSLHQKIDDVEVHSGRIPGSFGNPGSPAIGGRMRNVPGAGAGSGPPKSQAEPRTIVGTVKRIFSCLVVANRTLSSMLGIGNLLSKEHVPEYRRIKFHSFRKLDG